MVAAACLSTLCSSLNWLGVFFSSLRACICGYVPASPLIPLGEARNSNYTRLSALLKAALGIFRKGELPMSDRSHDAEAPAQEKPLESWKEIAAYLQSCSAFESPREWDGPRPGLRTGNTSFSRSGSVWASGIRLERLNSGGFPLKAANLGKRSSQPSPLPR